MFGERVQPADEIRQPDARPYVALAHDRRAEPRRERVEIDAAVIEPKRHAELAPAEPFRLGLPSDRLSP